MTGSATGRLRSRTDSWLPTAHAGYGKEYGKRLDGPGTWYGPDSLPVLAHGRDPANRAAPSARGRREHGRAYPP
ncbi:hypothetical protein ACWDFL_24000 [Streptomyces bungoensis]